MVAEISWVKRRRIAEFVVGEGLTVEDFCRREAISKASFHRIRARVVREGVEGMAARKRGPASSRVVYGQDVEERVVAARQQLEAAGLDGGGITVHFYWTHPDVDAPFDVSPPQVVPSVATINRILQRAGVAHANRRKRPHSSIRRFQRRAVNELWQLDGIDHRLPDGTPVCIYQIIDDASRVNVALPAREGGECGEGAINALQWGFDHYGVPVSVLTDNGAAFNTHRLGRLSVTEVFLARAGVLPISGRVGHPQTQGKTERSHQEVRSWLAAHRATTVAELNAELEACRHHHNAHRPHQAHSPMMTPDQAWQILPHAEPPTQPIELADLLVPRPRAQARVRAHGVLTYQGHTLYFGMNYSGTELTLTHTPNRHLVATTIHGQVLADIAWPPPTHYTNLTPDAHVVRTASQKH